MDVEIKAKSRLKGNVNLLFRFRVDKPARMSKLETVLKDFLHLRQLCSASLGVILDLLCHLELNVKVAVGLIEDDY